ncbi:hypothetical protein [Streptomyces olivaceoviridis]|uniref:hypothetical protein n=1 Tax=Streptomyces olivaceoviridis TaxID=1921 RepID=UPI0037B98A51
MSGSSFGEYARTPSAASFWFPAGDGSAHSKHRSCRRKRAGSVIAAPGLRGASSNSDKVGTLAVCPCSSASRTDAPTTAATSQTGSSKVTMALTSTRPGSVRQPYALNLREPDLTAHADACADAGAVLAGRTGVWSPSGVVKSPISRSFHRAWWSTGSTRQHLTSRHAPRYQRLRHAERVEHRPLDRTASHTA